MNFNYNKTIRNQGYTNNANKATHTASSSDAWTNHDCYDNTNTVDDIDDCGFWATNDNEVDDIDDCVFFNVQK